VKPKTPYMVFARKWRPQTFADVVGQQPISDALRNAIATNRIANAYLFCGPRGIGKTSMARILAKALNCEKKMTPEPCGTCLHCRQITAGSDMDVIEIDGASYTKVDDVRELQEGIGRASYAARKKVYIIDEVHMLSASAFNALLKTIEEPPSHVVFVFATTAPEKIPETILSRCQRFDFQRIPPDEIKRRLEHILAHEEDIHADPAELPAILETIARNADGSMRDAEVALDQLLALGQGVLKMENVQQLFGLAQIDQLIYTLDAIEKRDTKALLGLVAELVNKGRDLERFVKLFSRFLRDLLLLKTEAGAELVQIPTEYVDTLRTRVASLSLTSIMNTLHHFFLLEEQMKGEVPARFLLEFTFIKLTAIAPSADLDSVLSQLNSLEHHLSRTPQGKQPVAPYAQEASEATYAESRAEHIENHSDLLQSFVSESESGDQQSAPDNDETLTAVAEVEEDDQPAELASGTAAAIIDPTDVKSVWAGLVREAEKAKPMLATHLHDAKPMKIAGRYLYVSILKRGRHSLAKKLLDRPENRELLKGCLQKVTGKPMELRMVSEEDTASHATPSPEKEPGIEIPPITNQQVERTVLKTLVGEKPPKKSDVQALISTDQKLKEAIEKIIKLFDGTLVSFDDKSLK
jgi:DNA polymerase-3 subunit gamma/tau